MTGTMGRLARSTCKRFVCRWMAYTGVLACLFLSSMTAYAAMGRIPFEELAKSADLIVHGMVVSIDAVTVGTTKTTPSADQPEYLPPSIAELRIHKVLKGQTTPGNLYIQFAPGEDSPNYMPGEQVVVFLKRNSDGKSYVTVGMQQGKYLIEERMVVNVQVPVQEFLDRIKGLN